MNRHHEVKSHPGPFGELWSGMKRHEVRRNDRGYAEGNTITIREWLPDSQRYTGRWVRGVIGAVTEAGTVGSNVFLPSPLCVFTFIEHARAGAFADGDEGETPRDRPSS